MNDNEIDWRSDPEVAVPTQPAIAVFRNPHDEIVMRQEDIYGHSEQFIFIAPHNARLLADALIRAAEAKPIDSP